MDVEDLVGESEGGAMAMTVYLRACPRCCGDMIALEDTFGPYRSCLQCGHIVETKQAVAA